METYTQKKQKEKNKRFALMNLTITVNGLVVIKKRYQLENAILLV